MAESFFATLETELLDRNRFRTQSEARMAVFDFIEGWYNPHRRHSALGQVSPVKFEKTNPPGSLGANLRDPARASYASRLSREEIRPW